MLSRKALVICLFINLFFVSSTCMADIFEKVSAGELHSLVLMEDKTLWSCGDNGFGQSGLGSSVPSTYLLKQVKGEHGIGFLQNIVAFDAGWTHSLAVDVSGFVYAWGKDDFGQLGNGAGEDPCEFPTKVHGVNDVGYLSNIVYVSAGRTGTHSLAIDSNGYVYAWGNNESGQCGNETYINQNIPILVLDDDTNTTGGYLGNVARIVQVNAGVAHSVALDVNHFVWHWGVDGDYGEYNRTYPKQVKKSSSFGGTLLSNIVQISCCSGSMVPYSIAVDGNGYVWEWKNSDSAYKVPGGEMGTDYLQNINEVRAGYYSMARTSDGRVLVWVKDEDYPEYEYPEYVPDGDMNTPSGYLENIVSIDSGVADHKLAVDSNGYGWAWGTGNSWGQLGVGNTDSWPEPVRMLCSCTQPQTGVIYVDDSATDGNDNGTSWEDAFTKLQSALGYARAGCGSEIWVAAGTYKPTNSTGNLGVSFDIVDDVNMFGHFAGFETSVDDRNLFDANNETILDGLIDPGNDTRVYNIVVGNSIVNATTIDGFTIQSAGYNSISSSGVYLTDSNVVISNCKVKDNSGNGIYATFGNSNSNLLIAYSSLSNNAYYGLRVASDFSRKITLTLKGSIISYNCTEYEGGGLYIDCINSNDRLTMIDNWIHNNHGPGIDLAYAPAATIRNNTIYENDSYGIVGSINPFVRNCIIRGNASGDFSGGTFSNVNYCCLQSEHSGEGNFVADPCFVNPPDDLHIKGNSPCKDKGDSNYIAVGETDIDGEGRIKYGRVDIGADEYYRSPDFDRSGTVDFKDLAILALAWLEENGEEDYNEICDLEDDDVINAGDLELFCYDWLWQSEGTAAYSQFGGEEGEETQNLKLKIQNYDDVKEILEWTDAIEAEIAKSAESSSLSADSAGSPQAEYKTFRQAIEKELLDMVKTTSDK